MTAVHRPLVTTQPCASDRCGHAYEAHVSIMHVSIPCIHSGCPCTGFKPSEPAR